tara:strand:- start:39023 stop:39442 length:420 start_codon:yes stop_codon:yes gene_type:complete
MVKGLAEFNRRWTAIPRAVRQAAIDTLEKNANELVGAIKPLIPIEGIEVAWTWGQAPKGSMALGSVGTSDRGLLITVFARGESFNPAWFEFGTAPRFTKSGRYSGQIIASPFFWPTYRAKKRRLRGRMTRNVKKAILNT